VTTAPSDTPPRDRQRDHGALCRLVLERGVATLIDLEAAIENQVACGGHLATSLVEVAGVKESSAQRLLAEHYHLNIGPRGRLPAPAEALLPHNLVVRHRIFPVKRSAKSLHVATDRPLDADTLAELTAVAGLPIRPVVVTPVRLSEALAEHAGGALSERERWLLGALNAGTTPTRAFSRASAERRGQLAFPAAAHYRRMSEHPRGIVPSQRQPTRQPPDASDAPANPEDGGFLPPRARAGTLDPADADGFTSEPPASADESSFDGGDGPTRITQPYGEGEDEGEKRDTQPWRDDDPEDDGPPMSVTGEFKASLTEAPPSAEARILEEHRRFRHRGPFTRPQAELAASQAPDVHMVLEILVRYARQFFERTVLFVVSGDQAELRFSHGLSLSLASLRLGLREEPSVVREAFLGGDPIVASLAHDGVDAILRNKLGIAGAQKVAVIPLSIRERVVAIFYGDDSSDGVDRDAVADVTDFIEICAAEISRLIISRKRP
jgi:hypothetical protein